MKNMQVTEVRKRWSELLRDVEAGETIEISRYGKVVAYLVPDESQARLLREKAVEEFIRRRDEGPKIKATLEEILAWRHEGHRI